VAVGGTELEVGAGSVWSAETAFNNSGGCSNSVARPSWQIGVGKPLEWPSKACTGRAVPDVSADSCYSSEGSGSNCWAYVYFEGFPGAWGGTSLASPIWAGLSVIWNKLNAAAGRPGIGFSAPLIYSLANTPSLYASDFHDITTGSNGFPARTGWDEATGWGSPNFNNLVNSELPAPTVTKVSSATGSVLGGGKAVTITGSGFTAATAVHFGSVQASSFRVVSNSSISVTAPPQLVAGVVDVTVTRAGKTSVISTADHYKYAPVITLLQPKSGPVAGGQVLRVEGAGFATGNATRIKFGTAVVKEGSCATQSECEVHTPPHAAGTVEVKATVNGVTSGKTSADQYKYE
jgi:subtilase family serine protease